uniref:Uncharacterized protein n=1 Tax=Cyanistes caeruleus TaxID=156563 RepID=A0A8C0ZI93_CYACU
MAVQQGPAPGVQHIRQGVQAPRQSSDHSPSPAEAAEAALELAAEQSSCPFTWGQPMQLSSHPSRDTAELGTSSTRIQPGYQEILPNNCRHSNEGKSNLSIK